MSKKKFKYLYLGALTLLPLSAITLAVSCSSRAHNLSFNDNINHLSLDDSALTSNQELASQISLPRIKAFIYQNSGQIFNHPFINFAEFNQEVNVTEVNHDDAKGTITVNIQLVGTKSNYQLELGGLKHQFLNQQLILNHNNQVHIQQQYHLNNHK